MRSAKPSTAAALQRIAELKARNVISPEHETSTAKPPAR
jgi:hypothetical protein